MSYKQIIIMLFQVVPCTILRLPHTDLERDDEREGCREKATKRRDSI